LAAFGGAIYQVTSIWLEYFRYDVIVSKTFTYQRQNVFPAVTICNMNPVKLSAIDGNLQLSVVMSHFKKSERRKRAVKRHADNKFDQPLLTKNANEQHSIDTVYSQSLRPSLVADLKSQSSSVSAQHDHDQVLSRHKRSSKITVVIIKKSHLFIKEFCLIVLQSCSNVIVTACATSAYYNALTKSYYCYYFYSSNQVYRVIADTHCQSNGDSLPHVDSQATWNFINLAINATIIPE
jgi:hypothetical protein